MPRGVSDISGLRNIKSMHSGGKRSIPRVASSAYLDLYMLQKEKERLEKEDAILEKRKAAIQKRLEDIKKEIEILKALEEKGRQADREEVTEEASQEKKWKKMSLSY
ncbi:MAG: hypothetical protein AB1488_11800 [Nitrospirota bacterium]